MTNSDNGMTIVSTLTINELNKNTNTYLWNFSNKDTWPVAYQYINTAGQLCTNIDLRAEFVTPENFLPIGEEFTLQTVLTKTEIRLYLNGELKAYYNAKTDFVLGGSFNVLNQSLVTSGQTSYGDAVRSNWKQLQLGVAPKCVTSQTAMKGTFSKFDIYKEPLMPVSGETQTSIVLYDVSYPISPENNTANFGAVLLNAAEGTTITYTSLDEDIAKFTEDGKLFLLKEGQARLKAKASTGEEKTCTVTATYSTIGIHDPSVFQDPASGYYYTVGSHCLMGYSKDMKSWAYAANSQTGYNAANKLFTKVYTQEFKDVYAYVKPGVANPEGVWAPALYYSKEAGKYFMYVTIADGTAQGKCAIVLTSSDKPDGPYKYEEMLVASAMTTSDVDKTNLMDELGITDKTKVPAKYTSANRSYPDCIDATVFETHDGKLWMVYGSFTCQGGIRMIQLDKKTGGRLAGANYKDNGTASELGTKDPYYGIQLAGSNGEGPFIMEVPSDKSSTGYYYFLWTSVGGLNAWGGYHMRMYRSEKVEGPYVDTKGQEATASIGRSNLGLRVMDNYKFTFMDQAYTSCGGNSALTASDPTLKNEYGKMFLHYHQKWADPTGANGFVTKSNQMFLNEDGWLVTAPFDYDGETIGDGYSKEDVTGEYEFILHRTSYTGTSVPNYDYSDAVIINLNADGKVTGKQTGTWELKDGKYITLKIGDDTYKGVVMKQTVENSSRNEAMVFTAVGDGNLQSVWGMKTFESSDYYAELDKEYVKMPADGIISKFTLPTTSEKYGFDISWKSDNTSVVSIDGGTATVKPGDAETTVTLTGTFTKGDFSKDYTWNVVIGAFAIPLNTIVDEDKITLPASFNDSPITWTSENDNIINASTGAVTRTNDDQTVKLTATINGKTLEYDMVVKSKVAIYTQDYTGVAAIDALTSTNLQDGVTIEQDTAHGSYLAFTHPGGNTNSRGGVTDFGITSTPDRYVISMDTILTAGNNQATELSISGSNFAYNTNINYTGATGCLLKLYSEKSEEWTINNNPEHKVTIPKDTWVSLKLYVDKTNETTWLKVTDSKNKVLYDANVDYIGNGEIKGLHLLLGRYLAVMCVDNINVY